MNELGHEILPKVVVASDIGEYVEVIDVDVRKTAERLKSSGLSDTEIESTYITITSVLENGYTESRVRLGYYTNEETDEEGRPVQLVVLNPLSDLQIVRNAMNDNNLPKQKSEDMVIDRMSRTLLHELEHRIVDSEGGMPEATAFRQSNLDQGITGQTTYENDPEEIRCRQAEKDGPQGLVKVVLRLVSEEFIQAQTVDSTLADQEESLASA